jgi:hypothetical protein
MDKGVYHHVLPPDEDDRVQAVQDEEHGSCYTDEPSPPVTKEQPQPIASSNVTGTIAFQNRVSNGSREIHAMSKTEAQPSSRIAAA